MNDLHKQRFVTACDNARLVGTLYAQWFTFFWTLNGAALAWLYGASSRPPHAGQVLLSALFVFLNALAVAACWYFWVATDGLSRDARAAQQEWSRAVAGVGQDPLPPTAALVPGSLIRFVYPGGMATFVANICAWALLPALTPG